MDYSTTDICVYDLEVLPGWFEAGFELPDGTVRQFVIQHPDDADLQGLREFLSWLDTEGYTLAGFNSSGYDDLVLTAFLETPHPQTAYTTSVDIIVNDKPRWSFDNRINSIDLKEILPGRIGLKKIGVCLGHWRLQELPIAYDKTPTPDEQKVLLDYNRNDLEITRKLLNAIQPELDLRGEMSRLYGVDLRSKGEAALAEVVLLEEYQRNGGTQSKKELNQAAHDQLKEQPFVRVTAPFWWPSLPNTPAVNRVRELGDEIFSTVIGITEGRLAKGALDRQVFIGDRYYTMGVGGLHSVDGPGCWLPAEDEMILDIDVASMYPSLILTQKLSPRQWGDSFLPIYKSIVDRRLTAKRAGDNTTAAVLKIAANGTYGKTSDIYSSLYDPQLTANVTVTGQLALLTMIALLDGVANVISANTDGVTMILKRDQESLVRWLVTGWEELTHLDMEFVEYAALYQKDVNNYLAVKTDGKVKVKGRFVDDWPDLRHTPSGNIIATAVKAHIKDGTPVESTIYGCSDINQFLLTQNMTGNYRATWNGQALGKVLRFYKSNRADAAPIIKRPGAGDKGKEGIVSQSESCVPVEDLPPQFPTDLNYAWYISEARGLIEQISTPKRRGMNAWAEVIHQSGLRPCTVPLEGVRSRAKVTYGETDFSSLPPGHVLGTGTGDGLLAKVGETTRVYRVTRTYPGKTRPKVHKDEGFELIYGARVPLTVAYSLHPGDEDALDLYYTTAELKRCR